MLGRGQEGARVSLVQACWGRREGLGTQNVSPTWGRVKCMVCAQATKCLWHLNAVQAPFTAGQTFPTKPPSLAWVEPPWAEYGGDKIMAITSSSERLHFLWLPLPSEVARPYCGSFGLQGFPVRLPISSSHTLSVCTGILWAEKSEIFLFYLSNFIEFLMCARLWRWSHVTLGLPSRSSQTTKSMTKIMWAEGRASFSEDIKPRLSLKLSWKKKIDIKLQKALCA